MCLGNLDNVETYRDRCIFTVATPPSNNAYYTNFSFRRYISITPHEGLGCWFLEGAGMYRLGYPTSYASVTPAVCLSDGAFYRVLFYAFEVAPPQPGRGTRNGSGTLNIDNWQN